MGSVMDYVECECGGVNYIDYYYKTRESFEHCSKCGKYSNTQLQKDENGNVVYENVIGHDGSSTKKLRLTTETGGGYGSSCIKHKQDEVSHCYCFKSKEEALILKEEILSSPSYSEIDLSKSYIYVYDKDSQQGHVIFGQAHPENYADLLND